MAQCVNVLSVRGELHHCRVGHTLEGGGALEPQVVGVHLGSVIAQSLIVLQVVQVTRCRVGWAFIELSGTDYTLLIHQRHRPNPTRHRNTRAAVRSPPRSTSVREYSPLVYSQIAYAAYANRGWSHLVMDGLPRHIKLNLERAQSQNPCTSYSEGALSWPAAAAGGSTGPQKGRTSTTTPSSASQFSAIFSHSVCTDHAPLTKGENTLL